MNTKMVSILWVSGLLLGGCSVVSDDGLLVGKEGDAGTPGGGMGGTAGNPGNDASPGSRTDAGGGSPPAAGSGGAPDLTDAEVCAEVKMKSESKPHEVEREIVHMKEIPRPIGIFFMLDNSKSMGQTSDGTHTTWEQAEIALTQFVNDPDSDYLDVGIQYFHPVLPYDPLLGERPEVDEKCDGIAHAQSAIPVGRLPEAADSVVESLAMTGPDSNTPTVGALTGAVNFCTAFQQDNPDEECIVVFITDGQPNGCGLDLDCHDPFTPDHKGQCVDPKAEGVLTPIVAAGQNAGVRTYTVGLAGVSDDGFDLLDSLAVAGGTDCTPDIPGKEACNTSETGAGGLLQAFNLIRDDVIETTTEKVIETVIETIYVSCHWTIPPPPEGEILDTDLVNVKLSSTGKEINLGRVQTEKDCGGADGIEGWYYDDPEYPETIHVCPKTCATVEADPDLEATIVFGCETIVLIE